MITVTSNAANQIRKIISNAPKGMDSIIIGVDKSGCSGYSYKLDFANSEELQHYESVNKDGAKIYIDPLATMFLLGSTMDYKVEKTASRFIFDNPNIKNTCGCGESFNI